ncbi:MAG: division/cell wall cluster transcriptional repressor MraZ [Pseudomonadota bacterium]
MAARFRGESHHKVDAKGRVSIPASFRRVLEASDPEWKEGLNPNLVIVYGPARQRYLECYTIEAINEVDEKIAALPRGSQSRRFLERMFNGQSFATSVDETGRLVLPQKLREKIELGAEAFFMATGDTFQIWKPETYESEEAATLDDWLEEQPEDFDPLQMLEQGA